MTFSVTCHLELHVVIHSYYQCILLPIEDVGVL